MGIVKLLFILLTCTAVGVIGGMFIVRNQTLVNVQLLISQAPIEITIGKLAAWSFGGGLVIGVCLTIAYVLLQTIQLQATKRKVRVQERHIETLQQSAKTKDDI